MKDDKYLFIYFIKEHALFLSLSHDFIAGNTSKYEEKYTLCFTRQAPW